MQVAVVLKEVQVPPSLVGKVMGRAGLAALRAGVEAAPLGLDIEVQAVGRHGGIQMLVLKQPGRFKAQAEGQNLRAVHVVPPVYVEVISWPSSGGEFHTQRRRAFFMMSRSSSVRRSWARNLMISLLASTSSLACYAALSGFTGFTQLYRL